MSFKALLTVLPLCLAFGVGCLSPVQRDVDALVCNRAGQQMDVPPPGFLLPPKEATPQPPVDPQKKPTLLQRMELPGSVPGSDAPKIVPPIGFEKKDFPEQEKQ